MERKGFPLDRSWFLALLLLPCFEPAFVESQMPLLDDVVLVWRLLALFVTFLVAFKYYGISSLMVSIFIFQTYLLIVTVINDGAVASAASSLVNVVSVGVIMEMAIRGNAKGAIAVLKWIFGIYLAISLATTVAHPEGLYWSTEGVYEDNSSNVNALRYFLGHKNMMLMFLLPGIIAFSVDMLWRKTTGAAVSAICFLLGALFNAWLVDSVTSMVVACLALVALIVSQSAFARNRGPFLWLGIAVGTDVAVTVLRIQERLSGVIEALGRDVTFSGRVGIWDWALYWVEKNPLFGYGLEASNVAATRFGSSVITSAHNVYFTNLYYGGFVGLALFALGFVIAACKLRKMHSSAAAFLKLLIPLLLVMGIFETMGIGATNFIVPLVFACNADVFEKNDTPS